MRSNCNSVESLQQKPNQISENGTKYLNENTFYKFDISDIYAWDDS